MSLFWFCAHGMLHLSCCLGCFTYALYTARFCGMIAICPSSASSLLSLSPSATQHTHPRVYQAGSIANIPRSTTAVLQCTPGFHGNSRCPPASTLHRTFFFIPSSTCLDVLRGLFAKHSIENGDDGGWCGAGLEGGVYYSTLFYNFPFQVEQFCCVF